MVPLGKKYSVEIILGSEYAETQKSVHNMVYQATKRGINNWTTGLVTRRVAQGNDEVQRRVSERSSNVLREHQGRTARMHIRLQDNPSKLKELEWYPI